MPMYHLEKDGCGWYNIKVSVDGIYYTIFNCREKEGRYLVRALNDGGIITVVAPQRNDMRVALKIGGMDYPQLVPTKWKQVVREVEEDPKKMEPEPLSTVEEKKIINLKHDLAEVDC